MGIEAKILADSIAPSGKRLTTWQLKYHRFQHAELMTHRLFSRNSASSRAIPVKKLLEQVKNDPAMPVWWGKNQAGMQAQEELDPESRAEARRLWLEARDRAVGIVDDLIDLGLHKQIANRLLEPWMWITVIVSATEFENWFRLRAPAEGPMDPAFPAQPEIQSCAVAMRDAYAASTPMKLAAGEWHLPLVRGPGAVDGADVFDLVYQKHRIETGFRPLYNIPAAEKDLCQISVARCARVSYLTHDGRRDFGEDLRLHNDLAIKGHWSPFEHVAQALDTPEWSGNFCGWRQYRETIDPHFTKVGRGS